MTSEFLSQHGYGSKFSHQGTAGFGPWLHLPGCHFGCPILIHSHMMSGFLTKVVDLLAKETGPHGEPRGVFSSQGLAFRWLPCLDAGMDGSQGKAAALHVLIGHPRGGCHLGQFRRRYAANYVHVRAFDLVPCKNSICHIRCGMFGRGRPLKSCSLQNRVSEVRAAT